MMEKSIKRNSKISFSLFLVLFIIFPHLKMIAQCDPGSLSRECINKISEGFIYLKSFSIDGQENSEEKIEYTVVMSNNLYLAVDTLDVVNLHTDKLGSQMMADDGLNRLGRFALNGGSGRGFRQAGVPGVRHQPDQDVVHRVHPAGLTPFQRTCQRQLKADCLNFADFWHRLWPHCQPPGDPFNHSVGRVGGRINHQ